MSSLDVRSKQAPPCTNGTASKNELPKAADRAQSVKSSSDKQPKSKILNTSGILRLVSVSALVAFASWIFSIAKEGKPILLPESYALCSPNGQNIYTVDDHNTKVQCMLINRTRIIATGSLHDILAKWQQLETTGLGIDESQTSIGTPLTVKYIPASAIVVPGLSDAHGHILEYGASRQLFLESAKDKTAAVALVRSFILAHPELLNDRSRFIEGWGWDHTSWPEEAFPAFTDFESDPIVRGRPIILQSKDGHALWVSETVISSSDPFPDEVDGGVIVRDAAGQPTGVFLDNAQDLLSKPKLTDEDRLQRFMYTVNDALAWGLTSLHDAGFNPASLAFFQRRAKLGELPIRVYGMTHFDETAEYWGNKQAMIIDHNRLTARSVKIFADGALRSGGAALYEPYADNPSTNGFMRLDPEILYKFVPKFLQDGWQVNIHAIGDRANAIILDVFESALRSLNATDVRPRIEHAQIMLPADMKRLARLGVIASVQPTHAVSDMWYAQDRLGPERIKNLYAFRSIIDAGGRICLGSDFPVENINPLAGFHAAITRVTPDGRSPHGPGGWFPEQRLTRLEALRGITIDPAHASFSEKDLGSLVPGKIADYVVLSQDIMAIPAESIMDTKVLATALDGKPVFGHI